jgi:hypothetical protein
MPSQTLWTLAEIFILVNLGLAYKLDRIVYFRLTYDKLAALLGKGQRTGKCPRLLPGTLY